MVYLLLLLPEVVVVVVVANTVMDNPIMELRAMLALPMVETVKTKAMLMAVAVVVAVAAKMVAPVADYKVATMADFRAKVVSVWYQQDLLFQ
jgi:hypothetical protein